MSLRGCLGAVHDNVWLVKLGLNQILVDGVVQQVLGCLSELELDDERSRPPPLASNLQPDVMAAMLAVKYFAHQADKTPLTKVSHYRFYARQHSVVHAATHLGNKLSWLYQCCLNDQLATAQPLHSQDLWASPFIYTAKRMLVYRQWLNS